MRGLYKLELSGRRPCSEWPSGLSLEAEQSIQIRSRSMDLRFVQVGLCGPRASEWAPGLSLTAEQSIQVGSRSMHAGFVNWTLWKKGMFGLAKWAFPCCETKHGSGQEAWIWGIYKLDFVEGHVQSGQVGFPLMLNKYCNFTKEEAGTRILEVHKSMLSVVGEPSYLTWHILEGPQAWKTWSFEDISVYKVVVVLCPWHTGWGVTGAMLFADEKCLPSYTNDPSEQRST